MTHQLCKKPKPQKENGLLVGSASIPILSFKLPALLLPVEDKHGPQIFPQSFLLIGFIS